MERSREQFDFGLEECVIEASPDFDESPAGQSPAKKTQRQKMATKKEREHLVKEVRAFLLHELTTICLDAMRFKLTAFLFGISSSKGIDGADNEKLLIRLAGAPNTTMLAKPSTVVSETRKLPPPMSLFGVLSIPQFDNTLTTASTNDFCSSGPKHGSRSLLTCCVNAISRGIRT